MQLKRPVTKWLDINILERKRENYVTRYRGI